MGIHFLSASQASLNYAILWHDSRPSRRAVVGLMFADGDGLRVLNNSTLLSDKQKKDT
jgi:hypothetical protein